MSSWQQEVIVDLLRAFLRLPSFLPSSFRAGLLQPEPLELLYLNVPARLLPRCLFLCSSEAASLGEKGVPIYPLCNPLGHALYEWMAGNGFPMPSEPISGLSGGGCLENESRAWGERIQQLLKRLQEIMHQVKLRLEVQEPCFSQLREKLSETLYMVLEDASIIKDEPVKGATSIVDGNLVLLNDVLLHEAKLEPHDTSTHARTLLTLVSYEKGKVLLQEVVEETEMDVSVSIVGLHSMPENDQPLKITETILETLKVEGLKALLGFRYTIGSIAEALPPARSLLLASFLDVNTADVAGAKLTVGARALAKHVHRSSSGWWGPFSGNDEEKNDLALNRIAYLIQHACWQNIHHIPPSSSVFEIRVKDGYGARWTADGTKFRGFLEPQMVDGHEKRWRH